MRCGYPVRECRRRYRVLHHWLRARRTYDWVSSSDLTRYLCGLGYRTVARRLIRNVILEGDYWKIRLHTTPYPLYWPRHYPFTHVLKVIAEIYDRNHWHYYQVDETRVEPGDLVIDCGAAEGLLGLSATTQASYVYLIEPTPTFVGALRCTFRELNNCTIIPTAIGDTRGVAALREDSIASRLDDTGLMNVAVETIDHLFYDQGIHIDYIKSDIECHELAMLQGAQRLIARCKPRMALAVYHDGQDPYKLVQAVPSIRRDYCYRFKRIHPSNGQPLIAHFW